MLWPVKPVSKRLSPYGNTSRAKEGQLWPMANWLSPCYWTVDDLIPNAWLNLTLSDCCSRGSPMLMDCVCIHWLCVHCVLCVSLEYDEWGDWIFLTGSKERIPEYIDIPHNHHLLLLWSLIWPGNNHQTLLIQLTNWRSINAHISPLLFTYLDQIKAFTSSILWLLIRLWNEGRVLAEQRWGNG